MMRPFITLPPDQPGYEAIGEMSPEELTALPARFHTPEWSESTPGAFVCRVCWGEGWMTTWPCPSALARGYEVFGPERYRL